jgi:hypothetical protein
MYTEHQARVVGPVALFMALCQLGTATRFFSEIAEDQRSQYRDLAELEA